MTLDADDLTLLATSVRAAMGANTGAALDAALIELGWPDLLDADPRSATRLLATIQGETRTGSSIADDVVLHALGQPLGQALVSPISGARPPGRLTDDAVVVDGIAGPRADSAATLVVPTERDGVTVLAIVDTAALEQAPVGGLDPSLGLRAVSAGGATPSAVVALAPPDWTAAVAAVRVALAHELVGLSRAMLSIARDHAVDRIQFGRPIGAFQAVRHRLAETLATIEAADAAATSAVDFPGPQTAALAKVAAGEAARAAGRNGLQVLGGIGFTSEHGFHPYLRRANVLDQRWGSSSDLATEIGWGLLETRTVPRLVDL